MAAFGTVVRSSFTGTAPSAFPVLDMLVTVLLFRLDEMMGSCTPCNAFRGLCFGCDSYPGNVLIFVTESLFLSLSYVHVLFPRVGVLLAW